MGFGEKGNTSLRSTKIQRREGALSVKYYSIQVNWGKKMSALLRSKSPTRQEPEDIGSEEEKAKEQTQETMASSS